MMVGSARPSRTIAISAQSLPAVKQADARAHPGRPSAVAVMRDFFSRVDPDGPDVAGPPRRWHVR